jgi:hypothetical protein
MCILTGQISALEGHGSNIPSGVFELFKDFFGFYAKNDGEMIKAHICIRSHGGMYVCM